MVVDVGCVCCVCRWQCGVVRNSSAWFVLVNGEWWSEVYFDGSSVFVKVWVGCSVG